MDKNMARRKIYRTIQGDTFDAIAYRLWKNEHLCRALMEANPDYMDVLIFGAGVELVIPEIAVPKKIADLPPWYGKKSILE